MCAHATLRNGALPQPNPHAMYGYVCVCVCVCRAKNSRKYEPVSEEVAAKLRAYYRPHNQELYRLLGRDLGWDAN